MISLAPLLPQWDGRPENPNGAGWHLLRRKREAHPRMIGMEEVWHYTPGAYYSSHDQIARPWSRPMSGVYNESETALEMDYIGPMTQPVETAPTHDEHASRRLEKVCGLPNGHALYVHSNGVGGHIYCSDEIGGGAVVWDTCLIDRDTLLAAIIEEARRIQANRCNVVTMKAHQT